MADIEPIKESPRIEPAPPKPAPKPIPQRKEVMLPKLVAPPDAPSMDSAPPQAPAPEEPVPIDAAPASAPPAPAAPAAAPAPPTAGPPPVEPPRFDAAYLSNPKPAYPPMSRRMGEEGRVSLLVMVEPDGSPSKVEIHVSSGFPRLDQAALEAVRKWKFVPARRGTEALASPIIVPLSFSLPR
jgi:protein TonB